MDTLIQDLRYALRQLHKSPGFTAVAVITLALGIGANTAIFSVVYQVMFRRLPYAHPERLVKLVLRWKHEGIADNVTPVLASAVVENNRVFQSVAIEFPSTGCNLVGGSTPEYVPAKRVSAGFFHTLGVEPALGREFLEQEAAGNTPSAILSYNLWRSRFGGDSSVLGRQIECNGHAYVVVGVLPRSFRYARRGDVWLPDRLENHLQDNGLNYDVIARLRPGASVAQAREDGRRIWAQLSREHAGLWWVRNTNGFDFIPYQQWLSGDLRQPLLLLLGAVGLVLLIAAANVAGLMLARTTARAREIAVRSALGATRGRIVGQLLTETVLFSLLGGAVGVLLAWYLNGGLKAMFPAEVALHMPVQLDLSDLAIHGPVLAFTLTVSCLAGILAGIAPGLHLMKSQPNVTLKQGERSVGATRAQRRGRNLLLVSEVALSVVLLVGSALLVRSFLLLRGVDLGFDPHNLQVAQLSLASQKFAGTAAVTKFQQKVLERIRTLPGVLDAASISSAPLEAGLNLPMPEIGGRDCSNYPLEYRAVSPSYFAAMRIALVRGRAFQDSDTAGSEPVMIVNQAMVRQCWPNGDPVGVQVQIGRGMEKEGLSDLPRRVVGVMADIKEFSPDQAAPPMAFVPQAQVPDSLDALLYQSFGLISAVVIRSSGPVDLSVPVERAVHAIDPQQPLVSVAPMSQLVSDSVAFSRVLTILMGAFAALALLLSAVGLYGLLSYQVTQRSQEIGIRMALGAPRERMLSMVVGEGLALAGTGAAVGIAASVVLSRLLASLLYGVHATDVISFAAATTCLLAMAVVASYIPARRATKVDPMVALRYE